jgi:hypothetical protein
MSVLPLEADIGAVFRHFSLGPTPEVAGLFDHLVGACEQRIRHGDLQEKWRVSGPAILDRLEISEPAKLVDAISRLAPRDVAVTLDARTYGNLPLQEWRLMVDLVRLIRENAPPGANALPSEIVPALEDAIRSHFAKEIEQ